MRVPCGWRIRNQAVTGALLKGENKQVAHSSKVVGGILTGLARIP